MSNLRDIRRRTRGIQNTQKITKTMQMVAATRMRRAGQKALAMKPYATELAAIFQALLGEEADFTHALAETRPVAHQTFVVITSDRGLCGSFNSALLRQAVSHLKEKAQKKIQCSLIPIGRKGYQFFKRRHYTFSGHFTNLPSDLTTSLSEQILHTVLPLFEEKRTDEVWLVYNQYVSTLVSQPVFRRLLPIQKEDLGKGGTAASCHYECPEPLLEPGRTALMNQILPQYLTIAILQALLESSAGELSARMRAMDQATKNAGELIGELTLLYNKARQASITKEILEVVGGAEALTKG